MRNLFNLILGLAIVFIPFRLLLGELVGSFWVFLLCLLGVVNVVGFAYYLREPQYQRERRSRDFLAALIVISAFSAVSLLIYELWPKINWLAWLIVTIGSIYAYLFSLPEYWGGHSPTLSRFRARL